MNVLFHLHLCCSAHMHLWLPHPDMKREFLACIDALDLGPFADDMKAVYKLLEKNKKQRQLYDRVYAAPSLAKVREILDTIPPDRARQRQAREGAKEAIIRSKAASQQMYKLAVKDCMAKNCPNQGMSY